MSPLTYFGIGNLYQPRKDMTNKYRGGMNEGLGSIFRLKIHCPRILYIIFMKTLVFLLKKCYHRRIGLPIS